MRLCRFGSEKAPQVGFYDEQRIVPLAEAIVRFSRATGRTLEIPTSSDLLEYLPPDGYGFPAARDLAAWVAAPKKPGIFIYARRRGTDWQALYIGESANLSTRLAFNEIAADALLSGATDIHILKTDIDAKDRRDLADRLIVTNRPPLNEDERTKLEGVAAPKSIKNKSRAA